MHGSDRGWRPAARQVDPERSAIDAAVSYAYAKIASYLFLKTDTYVI
jgi:hypothetical protein